MRSTFGTLCVALCACTLAACSGGRSESLRCKQASDCPDGMLCSPAGLCEPSGETVDPVGEPTLTLASASGSAAGAPVTVTLLLADGTSCEQASCRDLPLGSQVTFRAPLVDGYRFLGWAGSAECVGDAPELIIASLQQDTECVARYARRLRASGVDPSGQGELRAGSDAPFARCDGSSCEVDLGSAVVLSAAEGPGQRFLGWSGPGCDSSEPTVEVTPREGDLVCTANYVPRLSVVGRVQGAEGAVLVESGLPNASCRESRCLLDEGGSVRLIAPQLAGYRFSGWTGSAACTGDERALELENLRTSEACTASYVPRRRVTGGSTGAPVSVPIRAISDDSFAACTDAVCEIDVGGSVILLAPSIEGYRLRGWSGEACEGQLESKVRLENVQSDLACTAEYVEGIAVSGALLGAEGQVLASSDSPFARCQGGVCIIDAGGAVTLTAPSLPERRFLGWEGDPGCSGQEPTLRVEQVAASRTCYARYATRYRVGAAAEPSAGGIVSASAGAAAIECEAGTCTVDAGQPVTLEARAVDGYRFSGWSGGGPCSGQEPIVRIAEASAHLTCTARFVGRFVVTAQATPAAGGGVVASARSAAALCMGASCSVDAGGAVALIASAAPGYRFAGWSACAESSAPELVLEALARDVSCVATFVPLRFTVASGVEPPAGGAVSASSSAADAACAGGLCTVSFGSEVTLAAVPAPGYAFVGFSGCAASSEPTLTLGAIVADAVCTASFARLRLEAAAIVSPSGAGSVTASSTSPGALCEGGRCQVDWGSEVLFSATAQPGHRFAGYTGCAVQAEPGLRIAQLTESVQCRAEFVPLRYAITGAVEPAGGGSIRASSDGADVSCTDSRCVVSHGGRVSLVAVPEMGYRFLGWSGCADGVEPTLEQSGIMADALCTASFGPIPVELMAGAEPALGGSVVALSDAPGALCEGARCTLPYGAPALLTATPASGYGFVGWSRCADSSEPTLALPSVQGPVVCIAQFAPLRFRVTGSVEPTGGGTVAASSPAPNASCAAASCEVDAGAAVSLVATPSAGYDFVAWSGCDDAEEPTLELESVTANATCTATFARTQVAAAGIVNPAGSGSVSARSQAPGAVCAGERCLVPFGSAVELSASAAPGFRFVGFSGCLDASTPLITLPSVEANVLCQANFAPLRFTVLGSVSPSDGGSVAVSSSSPDASCAGSGCSVNFGGSVTLSASPALGYEFVGFSGCADSAAPSLTRTNVEADATCTANFARTLVSALGTVSPAGSGSVSASSEAAGASCEGARCLVPYGSAVALLASPAPGFRFVGFSGCVEAATPALALPSLQTNVVCQANFAPQRFMVVGAVEPSGAGLVAASSPSPEASCAGGGCSVNFGSAVTLVASAAAGYDFVGFRGCGEARAPSLTLASVSADATCTATFARTLLVAAGSVSPAGAGAVSARSAAPGAACEGARCVVPYGSAVGFEASAAPGFRFVGFSGCAETATPSLALPSVQANVECQANFVPLRFTVIGDVQPVGSGVVGASSPAPDASCEGSGCSVNVGGTVTLAATPTLGFQFAGWQGCAGDAATLTLAGVSSDLLCTATFTPVVVNVVGTPNPAEGGVITASSPAPGAVCQGAGCALPFGSPAALGAAPAPGFRFSSWSECASSEQPTLALAAVTGPTACRANFERIVVTVTGVASPAGAGTVIGSVGPASCGGPSCNLPFGGTVTLSASAAAGFRFARFSGCGESAGNPLTLSNVQASATCVAEFERDTFTLTVRSSGPYGRVSIVEPPTDCGGATCSATLGASERATIEAINERGFVFTSWSGCAATGQSAALTVTADTTCTANFAAARTVRVSAVERFGEGGARPLPAAAATLVASSNTPGAVCQGGSCAVPTQGSVTLSATAAVGSGFQFADWFCAGTAEDDGVTSSPLTLTNVTTDLSCTAFFERPIDYVVIGYPRAFQEVSRDAGTVTASSPSAWATCDGDYCSVLPGSNVSLTARANTNYRFVSWSCPELDFASRTPTITLTDVQSWIDCYADFVPTNVVGVVGPVLSRPR